MLDILANLVPLIGMAFYVWMLVDCIRFEPDRGIWLVVILFLPGLGLAAYFFARFLPRQDLRWLKRWMGRFHSREIRQLEISARQIGNAYHWLQLAEKQRELQRHAEARNSYEKALEKEPDNQQARWGLALTYEKLDRKNDSLELVDGILREAPDYKFGDVSLARGRLLMELERWEEAEEHFRNHVRRWRQPEGLYEYAVCLEQTGQPEKARNQVEELLMDLEASPRSIARRQSCWKRKAIQLRRRL